MSKFSVLLSVYHREQTSFMRLSLDSIFNQTVRPAEVVLVEDGPLTPELYALIEEYKQKFSELKVVKLEKNGGLGNALNEGLKHCTYDLVARMDTDDVCKPHRFERQLQLFAEHPEVDVCSSWIDEFIDDITNVVSQRKLPEWTEEIVKYAKGRCPVNHPAVMYRRSKVMEVGGYQGFPEDSYLWVKMMLSGAVFHNLQESLIWFRTSDEVYKRRGGWKYAKDDIKAQWNFYKMGFLSFFEFLKCVAIRGTVRIMPNNLRAWVYKTFLRR
ncbi:MAG: glycosyltransferase [Alphaproteobacteria bacterium]|nr:glycosyltransferase [Alphaproteobacteria bacterium]